MLQDVKRGLLFTLVTMLLFGGGYHLLLWGVARAAFPDQAEGSLIRDADGRVVASRLIAQGFDRPEYFHPRPSAVDYNAASAGGSNAGPTNPDHIRIVRERLDAATALEGAPASRIPSEMVTASGSGLDPHIAPAAAQLQAERVALARGVQVSRVSALIVRHVEPPALGFLGGARVNVLELNLAIDRELGPPARNGPADAR